MRTKMDQRIFSIAVLFPFPMHQLMTLRMFRASGAART
jgi:hypothetical protein